MTFLGISLLASYGAANVETYSEWSGHACQSPMTINNLYLPNVTFAGMKHTVNFLNCDDYPQTCKGTKPHNTYKNCIKCNAEN